MPKSRSRKKPRREPRLPDSALGRRLVSGARIDLGDMVLTAAGPGLVPSYADEVARVKEALAAEVPTALGFDPFARLRRVNGELDDLVTEVDDWIRVGDHAHVTTVVRRTIPVEGRMLREHYVKFDDVPDHWARDTARVVADLRSHLDNLVYQLVTRAAPEPLAEEVLERLSYPVDDPSRPQTLVKLRKRLPYLSDDTLAAILAEQPSQSPDGVEHQRSYLWMLNKLNNVDKHRALTVAGAGFVTRRGRHSTVFAEGEILIPAEDITGGPCLDECMVDAMVAFGVDGATQFAHDDGTFEPVVGLCRFLRSAFALVGGITLDLLDTEGILDEWERALEPESAC